VKNQINNGTRDKLLNGCLVIYSDIYLFENGKNEKRSYNNFKIWIPVRGEI